MRKTSRILSLTLALLLITAAILPSAAFADYGKPTDNTSVKFKTALVVASDANIPTTDFTYSIEPGAAVTNGSLRVLAGLTGATVTEKAEFKPTDSTTAGGTNDEVTTKTNEKYATKELTINFGSVGFDEPGVYRYTLKQTAPTSPYAIKSGTNNDLTLDVYIQVDNTDNLIVAGYTLYDNVITTNAANGGDVNGKIGSVNMASTPASTDLGVAYINVMSSNDLSFAALVAGNQGSSDKYFKYTLELTGLSANAVVEVTGQTKEPVKSSATNYTAAEMKDANNRDKLTADADGKITQIFYLDKGDVVTVSGLPKESVYKLTVDAEDYTAAAGGTLGGTAYNDSTNGTIGDTAIHTGYTFTRNGNVPTGVILTVAPFAVIMLVGIGGAALVLGKRKRTED